MIEFRGSVIFTCPRCSRKKDFGSTYIPPLGRSHRCECGLSTVVRPTWGSSGEKTLVSASGGDGGQKAVTVPVDEVLERLVLERLSGKTAAAGPAPEPEPIPMPVVAPAPAPARVNPSSGALKSRPLGFIDVGPESAPVAIVRAPMKAPPAAGPLSPARASLNALPPAPSLREGGLEADLTTKQRMPEISVVETIDPALLDAREMEPTALEDDFDHDGPTTQQPVLEPVERFAADGGMPTVQEAEVSSRALPPGPSLREGEAAKTPGIVKRTLSLSAKLLVALGLVLLGWGYTEYSAMVAALPPLDKIKNYRPPIVSEVRTPGGLVVGKFFEEERYVVPLEEVPLHVRRAFLASEDAGFYEHSGVDAKSIVRALIKNMKSDKRAQGGSTITQQVARTFLLTREKTYKRKIAEIMLSRRLEKELSKDEILHRYLNQIFFGHGAHGIEAAARIHFGKHARDLTIAEGALLAGLPQAPSRYAPQTRPEEALRRRKYVLQEMANNGWITEAQRAEADASELVLRSIPDPTKALTPFVTEQIRREMVAKYGHDAVYEEGLQIVATVDTSLQFAAQEAVRDGLAVLDHRIGYRPTLEKIEPPLDAAKIEAAAKALGTVAPKAGENAKAIVESVSADRALVSLPGGAKGVLHRIDNPWAYPVIPEAYYKVRKAEDLRKVLVAGDVIRVRALEPSASLYKGPTPPKPKKAPKKGAKPAPVEARKVEGALAGRLPLLLVQEPEVEGSLLSFTIPEGRVLAMVGGKDFQQSEFLRPMQARRQAGSTFKTIVYAAALAKKPPPGTPKDSPAAKRFTLATILQDSPLVMAASEAELASAARGRRSGAENPDWKPANSGDEYHGDTPLRTAFILSRNIPTLRIAQRVGIRNIIAFAKKLGIESQLPEDLSIALGSASVTLMEISRAHAVFPAGGVEVKPHFVERVVDRDGKVVFDLAAELATQAEAGGPAQLVEPKTAFVMTQLLADVARNGTASKIGLEIKGINSGGKTGTTNDYIDAWYVGFTPRVLTGVWVGYDQVRSLGVGETGAEAALPIWIDFMRVVHEEYPEGRFVPPEGVVKLRIDRASGKRARPGQKPEETVETWFVKGTEPKDVATARQLTEEPNIFEVDPGLR